MNRKKDKDFDCVEMKRALQEQLYEETKGMTPEEYRAFIRRRIADSEFASCLMTGMARAEASAGQRQQHAV